MKLSVCKYIDYYNQERLHSSIGYVTQAQKLKALETEIFKRREDKLAQAREQRKRLRQQAKATAD